MSRTDCTVVRSSALAAFAAFLAPIPAFASASPGNVVALTARGNALITFDAGTPTRMSTAIPVSGLPTSEVLLGIDYRPSTGDLVALGSSRRLYRIDLTTGAASAIGAPFVGALLGTEFGFDFNPVPDRVRVVSDFDQSLRLHPDTGALVSTDSSLDFDATDANDPANPNVVAVAYTNSFGGAFRTTLFGIDSGLDVLVRIGGVDGNPSPNNGQVFTVGALGVDASALCGFDVSPNGGAYAAITPEGAGASQLYSIDLQTGAAALVGQIAGNRRIRDIAIAPPAAPRAFAITTSNRLVAFRPGTPGTLLSDQPLSGLLAPGEVIVGADFRPATGELYAVGSTSVLYRIDTATAIATAVGPAFTPALAGAAFGCDFNPIPDRVRVVSDADQNLRLNPETGAVASTDVALSFDGNDPSSGANPSVVASAYTNNFPGTTTTTLYGIDSSLDALVRQGGLGGTPSPNGGLLFTVGSLGVDASDASAFDISSYGGTFASLMAPGSTTSRLYTIHLGTGAASLIGTIGAGEPVVALAIEPPVTPLVYALTESGKLIAFAPGRPDVVLSSQTIQGVFGTAPVLGIDQRPATGSLMALSADDRLHLVNPLSALASPVGVVPFTPGLESLIAGFDVNPVPDRVRVVGPTDQNLRLSPNTGVVTNEDMRLRYDALDSNAAADAAIVAAAYSDNFGGAKSTTLYVIDSDLDILATQGSIGGAPVSPNTGRLFTVGTLGVDTSALTGFDVSPAGGAFASLTAPGAAASGFYSINVSTGQATSLGTIGGGEAVVDIAYRIRGL